MAGIWGKHDLHAAFSQSISISDTVVVQNAPLLTLVSPNYSKRVFEPFSTASASDLVVAGTCSNFDIPEMAALLSLAETRERSCKGQLVMHSKCEQQAC